MSAPIFLPSLVRMIFKGVEQEKKLFLISLYPNFFPPNVDFLSISSGNSKRNVSVLILFQRALVAMHGNGVALVGADFE